MKRLCVRPMTKKRQLSDLPKELLVLIMLKLSILDLVVVRVVCKTWNSVVVDLLPRPKPFPFSMSWIGNTFSSCHLRHASDPKRHYTIMNTGIPKIVENQINKSLQVWASKHGWLLIGGNTGYNFFFYTPFTNQIKIMPRTSTNYSILAATFSSPPTSPDCQVIAITGGSGRSNMTLKTCRLADKKWITTDCKFNYLYEHPTRVEYMNGMFYMLTENGNLATFDPAKRMLNWLKLPILGTPSRNKVHIVESRGELLLVRMHDDVPVAQIYNYRSLISEIYKPDESNFQLMKIRRLKDRALCVSRENVLVPELVGSDATTKQCLPEFGNEFWIDYLC